MSANPISLAEARERRVRHVRAGTPAPDSGHHPLALPPKPATRRERIAGYLLTYGLIWALLLVPFLGIAFGYWLGSRR